MQVEEKRNADAMRAAEKAEKKLEVARKELKRMQRVTQHASARAALAERFRFDTEGSATEECQDGAWEVRRHMQLAETCS
jgi:hypothetical protein